MSSFNFEQVSHFKEAEESPGFLLWRASTLWRRAIEATLKQYDLTHPQFVILATIGWLSRDGRIPRQIDISRHAALDPNTTSQILRGLQAKGLVERSHQQDERSKCSKLSNDGEDKLSSALKSVEAADFQFFKTVDMKHVTALEALRKLSGI